MNKTLYFIFHTSIIKTIRFNAKYFGFFSIFHPKVFLSRNVKLVKLKGTITAPKRCKKCHIGFSTNYLFSAKSSKTIFYNEGNIIIDKNFCISKGCSIVVKENGCLLIGNNCHISQNSQIECHKKISLGDSSIISWDCLIMDSDTHPIYNEENKCINEAKEIVISPRAWVCCRSIVLKGSYLGEESILAAGSIYTKQIYDNNVVIANNSIKKRNIQIHMDEENNKV